MKMPVLPKNEIQRLIALKQYNILDTGAELAFDDITSLAAQICETPIALISLLDETRQWFKSACGLDASETPRNISFCQYAIIEEKLFEVPNALDDERFFDNPLVTGQPEIRFYAGMPLVTSAGYALGTLCVIDKKPKTLSAAQRDGLTKLARQVVTQLEHRLSVIKIADMAEMLQNTGEMARVGGWELDLRTMQIYWSDEVFKIHELDALEAPTLDNALQFYTAEAQPMIKAAVELAITAQQPWDLELPLITAKNRRIWVRAQGSVVSENGRAIQLRGAIQDITQRKMSDINLAWLNRALTMLSKCNETLIYISDEHQLIVEICRIIVEVGGYRMAWVGYAQDDEAKSITPQAHYGKCGDYLGKIHLSWSERSASGFGPAARTIRDGQTVSINNVLIDPNYFEKDEALKQGFHSLIYLPLKNQEHTFGLLAMYSADVRQFEADEIRLHQELADNLAAGINNIRAKNELHELNAAMLKLAQAVSATRGETFLSQLLANLLDTVHAEAGYIAQLVQKNGLTGHTVAVQVDGNLVENFDYPIPQAIADAFFSERDFFIIANHAERDFPKLSMMRFYKYQALAGICLRDSSGNDSGLIFIFFKQPIHERTFNLIRSALKIFAARAASELERMRDDAIIREQASYLNKTHDAIVVRDMDDSITFWNKGAEALYGWTQEEAMGQKIYELLRHQPHEFNQAKAQLLKNGEWNGEVYEYDKEGNALIIESHWTLFHDQIGQPKSIFAIKTDVTNRKLIEEEIRKYAFFDSLTKLPNRRLLLDRLEKALSNSARNKQFGALFFLDLDNFKKLNDTLGHDKGDILLREVASRLSKCVRDTDTVARLGGDEFVIMVEDLGLNQDQAQVLASSIGDKIIDELNHSVDFDGYHHLSTPSIGISLFNHDTVSIDILLKQADSAMYESKAAGRNRMTFFSPG